MVETALVSGSAVQHRKPAEGSERWTMTSAVVMASAVPVESLPEAALATSVVSLCEVTALVKVRAQQEEAVSEMMEATVQELSALPVEVLTDQTAEARRQAEDAGGKTAGRTNSGPHLLVSGPTSTLKTVPGLPGTRRSLGSLPPRTRCMEEVRPARPQSRPS